MGIKKFGFDEFKKDIQKVKKCIPKALENYLVEMAFRLDAKVKEKTPVHDGAYSDGRIGGELIRGWSVSEIKKVGDKLQITVFNPTPYAIHVEYGHRTRQGKGKKTNKYRPKIGGKYLVEGRYMLEISLKEMEKEMPIHLQKILKELTD